MKKKKRLQALRNFWVEVVSRYIKIRYENPRMLFSCIKLDLVLYWNKDGIPNLRVSAIMCSVINYLMLAMDTHISYVWSDDLKQGLG